MVMFQLREPYAPPILRHDRRVIVRVGLASVGVAAIKPLRPTPNLISVGDLNDYVNLLDPLIQSLDGDVTANLATKSPDDLIAEAKDLEDLADKADAMSFGGAYAEGLRRGAASKREIAKKGVSGAALTAQMNFASTWRSFYSRWTTEAADVRGIIALTSGGDWTKLQAYDVEYQDLRNKYESLGFSSSMSPPPPPPDTPSLIPTWLPWLTGGAIVLMLIIYIAPVAGVAGAMLPART